MSTDTPAWLTEAMATHSRQQEVRKQALVVEAGQIAARINEHLERLNIVPQRPAVAGRDGFLDGALIVSPDWDEGAGSWGVRAIWNVTERAVYLRAEGGPGSGMGGTQRVGNAGPLESAADVVRAMYEGPLKPVIREGRSLGGQRIDTADVVGALRELTAAVLRLADGADR